MHKSAHNLKIDNCIKKIVVLIVMIYDLHYKICEKRDATICMYRNSMVVN